MTAAALFGFLVMVLGLFLQFSVREYDERVLAVGLSVTGFCMMVGFGLARIFS